jgi:hypothetical protein
VLFFFGAIFYYALIVALWLLIIIGLNQGSIGFDSLGKWLTNANPEAQKELAQYAPIVAALIIVVASQFKQVSRIDMAARAFCIKLAAIPHEADRLAIELAQSTDFQPKSKELRDQVTSIISDNISPQALNFNGDGTLSSRFTRAVALYWLFVGSRNNGRLAFNADAHRKSVYAKVMQLTETTAARADGRYKELMHISLVYFTSPDQARELEDTLNSTIMEVSSLICSLIARYVLCCGLTRGGRPHRLSSMGFDASLPRFGQDEWVMTVFAVVLLGILMMTLMPGTRPIPPGQILAIAITFGVSFGLAVVGAVVVAQRFIERHQGEHGAFPPIAELTLAALIVGGLSIALRIAIPLVPALIEGSNSGLQDVVTQFGQRWPGVITPFICTISLGLLCSYFGAISWSWTRVAAVGALGNGVAFMGAGWLVGCLIDPDVLAKFYVHPEQAIPLIVLSSGVMGLLVGAIVLAAFHRAEAVRKDFAARAVTNVRTHIPEILAPPLAAGLEVALPSGSKAPQSLGGSTRSETEKLEGRYVCFRPAFTSANVINAYIIVVRWDEAASCLIFEEQDRVDVGYSQMGRVYIPDGRPFMSFVTIDNGAMRLIMTSRPEGHEPARGLLMTLSNRDGRHYTPSSAPIVIRRVLEETPQLGFIRPGAPDYDSYRRDIAAVMPAFGFFAMTPLRESADQAITVKPADLALSAN